jgi:tetratricopeptide (TPR) repeat protein
MARWRIRLLADSAGAIAAVDSALARIDPESIPALDRPWEEVGDILLQAGALDRGRAALERRWDEVPDRMLPAWEKYRAEDRARLARAEGRPLDALTESRTLPPWTCAPCRAWVDGRLFDEAGQADSAVVAYERYLEVPYNFRLGPDSEWLGPTLERLGQLYDERGDLENAALYYARFVELWEDADPELQPRVQTARARMQQIVRQRG